MSTSSTNKFMNRMFRRVGGVVWDITTGTIGLQTDQGIYSVSFSETGEASLNVNPLDGFGLAIPAFATQSAHDDVNQGDIIVGDQGIIGWVTGKTEAAYKVLDHNGNNKTYTAPKVAIMGTAGVLVIRNLFSLTNGAAGAAGFANNLLPLLMMGGGDDKLEKMIPLLLMTGGLGGAAPATGAGANPMASMLPMLMLMKDKGGDSKMDPMMMAMMMGGLGGGAGGMNPMMMMALMGDGDLFGSPGAKTKALPATVNHRGGVPVLTPITGY